MVEIELAKCQDVRGEQSGDIALVAGVDHSYLDLSWDCTMTDLPCRHSHWDPQEVEGLHVLAPAHRIVYSSDERDFAKKAETSFEVAAFHDGEQTRFRWELGEMQMVRGSYVDTQVDFEAEEGSYSELRLPFLPRSYLRRLPPRHHHHLCRKNHLDLCVHAADPTSRKSIVSYVHRQRRNSTSTHVLIPA